MYDIETLRSNEFPGSRHTIFMNHASISPIPECTRAKVAWIVNNLAENPNRFWEENGKEINERMGERAARLLNARSAQEIVSVTTTSIALNMVAQSIDWQPGDNLLFCDVEFPANVYPWLSLQRDGVEIRQVPAQNGGLTLASLAPLVDEDTRLISASAIQFFTGHRTDLTAVGRFCQERNILFVVDAIQAIGHMKIDVQASGIDVLASGGQKSMMALPGMGLLYVRQELAEKLQPRIISGNATKDFEEWLDYDLTYGAASQRFAAGTPNLPGITAVAESLGLLLDLGVSQIDAHTRQLADHLNHLLEESGYEVISPRPAPGPIVTFNLNRNETEAKSLLAELTKNHIELVIRNNRAGQPHLRASLHCYNTMEEVEKFIQILRELDQRR